MPRSSLFDWACPVAPGNANILYALTLPNVFSKDLLIRNIPGLCGLQCRFHEAGWAADIYVGALLPPVEGDRESVGGCADKSIPPPFGAPYA